MYFLISWVLPSSIFPICFLFQLPSFYHYTTHTNYKRKGALSQIFLYPPPFIQLLSFSVHLLILALKTWNTLLNHIGKKGFFFLSFIIILCRPKWYFLKEDYKNNRLTDRLGWAKTQGGRGGIDGVWEMYVCFVKK